MASFERLFCTRMPISTEDVQMLKEYGITLDMIEKGDQLTCFHVKVLQQLGLMNTSEDHVDSPLEKENQTPTYGYQTPEQEVEIEVPKTPEKKKREKTVKPIAPECMAKRKLHFKKAIKIRKIEKRILKLENFMHETKKIIKAMETKIHEVMVEKK